MTQSCISLLRQTFSNNEDILISRAPGRINLIGEHTDYNKGFVLPAAINKAMYFACRPNQRNIIIAQALDLKESHKIDLNNLTKTGIGWVDYMIGILLEFKGKGIELVGFDCAITSEIPIGSGLSSSAAYDCAIIKGLSHLFKAELTSWEIVNTSNRSNNNFLGIKSGILDQFASVFGKQNKVMLLNCDNLEYQYIDIPNSDYTWLLINTCVKHSHLTSAYNDRVDECTQAVHDIQKIFSDVNHLSKITEIEMLSKVNFKSETVKKRAHFIISENRRVHDFVSSLQKGEFEKCGQLLYESHNGLSNDYEVSCKELDFLVDIFREDKDVLGARMMGGGFGGCTLNLVKSEAIGQIKEKAKTAYFDEFNIVPEFYDVEISDGVGIVND